MVSRYEKHEGIPVKQILASPDRLHQPVVLYRPIHLLVQPTAGGGRGADGVEGAVPTRRGSEGN
jgi:hypothetical protein